VLYAFTAGDLRDPSHDLPRAMSGALGITGLTYVLIAIAVLGTLTVAQLVSTARPLSPRPRGRRSATSGSR